MNERPNNYEETTRLISGLLDGQLSEEECVRLEVQLETDAAARRLYMQMIDQEIELACLVESSKDEKIVSLVAAVERQAAQNSARLRRFRGRLAAAAAIVLMFVLWFLLPPREEPPRATVSAEPVPVPWSEDFEDGSARGWVGEVVADGLPSGSKHGIRAARKQDPDGVYYKIELPTNWNDGLFALTERATLHITYRIGQPTWLNVLMHTLPADSIAGQVAMFRLTGSQFPGAAGQWQTASIPFSFFKRKVVDPTNGQLDFVGNPPQAGELAAALSFSAPHPLGLVIDRLWITPDGTGTETIQPLP